MLTGMNRFLYIYTLVAYFPAVMLAWYLGWTPLLLAMALCAQIAVVGWVAVRQRMTDAVLFAGGYGIAMPTMCAFGSGFSLFGTMNILLASALAGMVLIRWEMAYQTRQRGRALGLG